MSDKHGHILSAHTAYQQYLLVDLDLAQDKHLIINRAPRSNREVARRVLSIIAAIPRLAAGATTVAHLIIHVVAAATTVVIAIANMIEVRTQEASPIRLDMLEGEVQAAGSPRDAVREAHIEKDVRIELSELYEKSHLRSEIAVSAHIASAGRSRQEVEVQSPQYCSYRDKVGYGGAGGITDRKRMLAQDYGAVLGFEVMWTNQGVTVSYQPSSG